jgi:hypothetical protein
MFGKTGGTSSAARQYALVLMNVRHGPRRLTADHLNPFSMVRQQEQHRASQIKTYLDGERRASAA